MSKIQSLFRRVSILAAALVVAGSLSGCSSRLTSANLDKIEIGMPKKEVEAILGQPTKVDTVNILSLSQTLYIYERGEDRVTLTFVNDKLVGKKGSLSK